MSAPPPAKVVYPALLLLTAALTVLALGPRLAEDAPANAPTVMASSSADAPPASPGVGGAVADEASSVGGSGGEPGWPPPVYVREVPNDGACPEGMLLVDGVYCPFVGHRCTDFINEEKDVCQTYSPEVLCEGRLEQRRFCIDRYEYPNLVGVKPAVMMTFEQAESACAVEGKRLCTVREWEFACEGTQMWPYPYGRERSSEACNIDKPYRLPELDAFSEPRRIEAEVSRLDQREPSGERSGCVSPFGVHDMTGNVDEWVVNEEGGATEPPFRSTLKGGYWGPIRARCRPITSTHNAWFSFYQVGFRCCRDVDGAPERPISAGRATGGWKPMPPTSAAQ